MTYHVISLLNEGVYISCDRGFLVCRYRDGKENRVALADVRAIIAAHPAISFSNQALSRLLAQDSVILHCDRSYKPVGWSIPLERVIRGIVFQNQLQSSESFKKVLWKGLSLGKMRNQAKTLSMLNVEHRLDSLIEKPLASESNVARYYWQPYFEAIGAEYGKRERKGAINFENMALNYGYAVIATLVHRSLLIYGLLPSLGIHHLFRYRSAPLVYDVMEPCRAIVDYLLALWKQQPQIAELKWTSMDEEESESHFKEWIAFFMQNLRTHRIKGEKLTFKWLDVPDRTAKSVAKCFEMQSEEHLWLPGIQDTYFHPEGDLEEEALKKN